MISLPSNSAFLRSAVVALTVLSSACSGGAVPPTTSAEPGLNPWAGLAAPRPEPLPGAPRISVVGVEVAATGWALNGETAGEAVTELVKAGLLERTDLEFVERKRFGPAAERDRRGADPLPGQPPLGRSRSPELRLRASITIVPGAVGRADIQLSDPVTGALRHSAQIELPQDLDPVGAARTVVAFVAHHLANSGLMPPEAPVPDPPVPVGTRIGVEAVFAFLEGVRAGDGFEWEAARIAYQRAIREGGGEFGEAGIALRRAARLRAGGSLGVS